MDVTDIKVLLKVGERISFECKKAENNIPKSVWETYSSFANTIGGIIVLGITENIKFVGEANHFEITGVNHPQKLRKEFFDTLNSNKVNRNILTDTDVEIIDYEGVSLMCITVPQADYRQRPIYINGNMMNGAFKRNYEGDYHCTEEDVKAMIRDANDSGNDGLLIEHYNIDDIDSATLSAYRNRFRTANPDHIWNDYADKEFLLNIGAYTKDRNTGREGLTMAGLLLFGKGLSIRERFDNIRMDYLDYTNLEEECQLTISMVSLISAECETQLLEIYGDDYNKAEKEEQLILATALSEGVIANNTIQLLLDKNPLEAGKLLYALVGKDMLLSTNKGRWTTYSINEKYELDVKRQGVERQGVEKARSNKKEKIIEHIIAFCQEPHTLQEIAQELGFSDRYKMKRKYIDPLLGDILQMTFVESKNAPTQKYVVIGKQVN